MGEEKVKKKKKGVEKCRGLYTTACILSPRLFKVYGGYIIRRAFENFVGGESENNFVDDITLVVKDENEMTSFVEIVTSDTRN